MRLTPSSDVHLGQRELLRHALVALAAGRVEVGVVDGRPGSLEGRMLCTPWQLAQLATTTEPPSAASP